METTYTYALIDDTGFVYNVIVGKDGNEGERLALIQFFPEAAQIEKQTEETGLAVLHGTYVDGQFRSITPFPSWTWDKDARVWKAPIEVPVDLDKLWSWDEETGNWVGEDVVITQA
jgi:hypothetical protein